MDTCEQKIRKIAFQLLDKKEVEKVIGFANGTIPMATTPVTIASKEDTEKLVFNSTCGLNLANYIRQPKGKIAVIAKGCDARNIVTHVIENQVNRDLLYIIGVPCNGMIDKSKIRSLFEEDIVKFEENGDTLVVESLSKKEKLNKKDYLRHNCQLCQHKNPIIYDIMAGEPVQEQPLENAFPDVDKIAGLDANGRWQHFQNLTQNCIRCYACRNACPLCYCPTCFVDESGPQWVGKSQDQTDVLTFHFLRAFHCAGRCTDCGACVEACPMDINVRDFTRKLNKDAFDMFSWEAGINQTKRPPLDAYSPNDPNDFIK